MGSRSAHPNPQHVPLWNEEGHACFLKWAFEYYCSKAPNPRPQRFRGWREPEFIPPPLDGDVIDYLYRLGKDLQVLRGSYDEFCSSIRSNPPFQYWRRSVQTPFRRKQKYQRNSRHEKKA
ncbi:hypothetical protein K2X30_10145, partial [bacterium]|nr:hypothetical protein [bacterium]